MADLQIRKLAGLIHTTAIFTLLKFVLQERKTLLDFATSIVVVATLASGLHAGSTVHVVLATLELPAGITIFGEGHITRRHMYATLQSQGATVMTTILQASAIRNAKMASLESV